MNRGCDWIWACAMMALLLLMGRSYQQEKTLHEPGIRQVSPTIPQLVSDRKPSTKREPTVIEDTLDQGQPVMIKVGAAAPRSFLFRPQRALADAFQLTVGSYPNDALDAKPKVYEGLETEGHARASLVLIDGTLAGVIRDRDQGVTYIRTRPSNGRLESRYEWAGGMNAVCSVDGELSEMVSLQPLKEDLWEDVEDVVVAAVTGMGAAGARSNLDHSVDPAPLGELYEVSLKEANLVLVLDKTATGDDTPENLRAKVLLYLATAANMASHFEHQLGIRILVQEIILLPDIDSQQDIPTARESKVAVRGFQDWMEAHRPIHIHRWTLAAKFGAGLRSTTLGAGVIARLFSDEAVSVQRTEALWDVLAHEMGHNMGSDHTVGGLMNRETLAEGSDSFFHLMEEMAGLESPPVTAAKAIHEHASSKLDGDHPLRNPEEIPWAVDDEFVTPVNTLARLQSLTNDHPQTPYGLANASLRLAELSEMIPRDAGELDVFEDEILFLPKEDFQRGGTL